MFQRPHHLLTRATTQFRVVYVEEAVVGDQDDVRPRWVGEILVATPIVAETTANGEAVVAERVRQLVQLCRPRGVSCSGTARRWHCRWARCDLLFTGGESLQEAKSAQRRDARCFPSSVDAAHFQRVRAGPAGAGRSGGHPASPWTPAPRAACSIGSRLDQS